MENIQEIKEIHEAIKKIIDEMKIQPFGLDVAVENFDAEKAVWTIRMKEHFITFSAGEINQARENKDSLYLALKDLFLEKFQWLAWESV